MVYLHWDLWEKPRISVYLICTYMRLCVWGEGDSNCPSRDREDDFLFSLLPSRSSQSPYLHPFLVFPWHPENNSVASDNSGHLLSKISTTETSASVGIYNSPGHQDCVTAKHLHKQITGKWVSCPKRDGENLNPTHLTAFPKFNKHPISKHFDLYFFIIKH